MWWVVGWFYGGEGALLFLNSQEEDRKLCLRPLNMTEVEGTYMSLIGKDKARVCTKLTMKEGIDVPITWELLPKSTPSRGMGNGISHVKAQRSTLILG